MTVLSVSDYLKTYDTNTSRLAIKISGLMGDHEDYSALTISRQSIDIWVKMGTGFIEVDITNGDIISVKRISTNVIYDRGD